MQPAIVTDTVLIKDDTRDTCIHDTTTATLKHPHFTPPPQNNHDDDYDVVYYAQITTHASPCGNNSCITDLCLSSRKDNKNMVYAPSSITLLKINQFTLKDDQLRAASILTTGAHMRPEPDAHSLTVPLATEIIKDTTNIRLIHLLNHSH